MKNRYWPSLLLLAACSSAVRTPAVPQDVTITATEFSFAGPDSIAPGVTRIRLVNHGTQDHHLILGRVDDGKTVADVMAGLREHPAAAPPFLSYRGGANIILPGDSSASVSDLTAGQYVMFCFVPDVADQTPHFAKGMTKVIVVAGPRHEAPLPTADAEIRLKDFAFLTADLAAGTRTIHVVNDGPQIHEIQLVRLNDGTTSQQFLAGLAPGAAGAAGPPPGVFLGGPGALSTGEGDYWTVTLTPGKYLFLCFVPDAVTGAPHFAMGMVREVIVS
jgi:plastocyanin